MDAPITILQTFIQGLNFIFENGEKSLVEGSPNVNAIHLHLVKYIPSSYNLKYLSNCND